MTEATIADTGAIVALVSEKDQWHGWAKERAALLPTPYLTCEAVITEACHLLEGVHDGAKKVIEFLETGVLQIDFNLSVEINAISKLMNKYADVPMDFADACLVRMSETIANSVVFTLDSDFWIYRKNGKEPISLIILSDN